MIRTMSAIRNLGELFLIVFRIEAEQEIILVESMGKRLIFGMMVAALMARLQAG